ncbi:MAG: hypothetical protein WBH61_04880 [Candidatus Methylomirabilis sp.]
MMYDRETGSLWSHIAGGAIAWPGDNGAGIGASHQTGWTGLVAELLWATVEDLPGLKPAAREATSDRWVNPAPPKGKGRI